MSMSRTVALWALAGSTLAAPTTVWAVGGTTAAAVTAAQNTEFWYVGRVQRRTTAADTHLATGSYIRQGLVLTAGHAINSDAPAAQEFERFQLGGDRFLGLGVQHPSHPAGGAVSGNDIALMLLLNGRATMGGEVFPTLAAANAGGPAAGPDNLVGGNTAELIGFTGPGGTSAKRRGLITIKNPPDAGDVAQQTYTYRVPAGTDFSQPGDSGGPHVFDFGGMKGKRIVATVNAGNGSTISLGTRVDAHRGFIDGNGVGGVRVVTRMTAGANTAFDNAGRWQPGTGPAAAPGAGSVVVLDTTAGDDTGLIVESSADTPNLDGMLNDVRLRISGGHFQVVGGTASTPGSGVLNGGRIDVFRGGPAVTRFTVGWSMENASEFNVGEHGEVVMGSSFPNNHTQIAFLNSRTNEGTGAVSVLSNIPARPASLDIRGIVRNEGTFAVRSNSVVNTGATVNATPAGITFVNDIVNGNKALLTVEGDEAKFTNDLGFENRGTVLVDVGGRADIGTRLPLTRPGGFEPVGLHNFNGGKVTVGAAATLNVTNGLPRQTARFNNDAGAEFLVEGNNGQQGTATLDTLVHQGKLRVQANGRLTANRKTETFSGSTIDVDGNAATTAVFNSGVTEVGGPLGGGPGSVVNIGRRGTMRAFTPDIAVPPAAGAPTALSIRNGAQVNVAGGGKLQTDYGMSNHGRLALTSDANGIASFHAINTRTGTIGAVNEDNGEIVLTLAAGGAGNKPQLAFQDSNFVNTGKVNGPGRFIMTAASGFFNRRTEANGGCNFNMLDVVWDSAFTAANAPVNFEVNNKDNGAVVAGLTQMFALNMFCLVGGSKVTLDDGSAEEGVAGMEVLYTRFLGVSTSSTLDLAGRTLYYERVDAACGLDLTRIMLNGGQVIQIPAPGMAGLLTLVGVVAARRRRAVG
ncbi:MAG: trypsin-like serine protease [Phycisphaerales bacterium]